jgi:arylsulfatase A-like enzyme
MQKIIQFLALWFGLSPLWAAQPNIVLIYADDLGYGDISVNGATAVQTPNIDRLAREGINFRSGYCTSSTCTPSRFSMFTGKYAFRQEGTGILPGDAGLIIDPEKPTLPGVLREAGYRTGAVGKWHLGLGPASGPDWNRRITPGPKEVGFDFSFIMAATGDRVPCVYVRDGTVENLDPADPIEVSYRHGFPGLPDGVSHRSELKMDWLRGHNNAVINGIGRIGFMKGGTSALWKDEEMADVFAKEALGFITESKGKPFFLYYGLQDVHVPRVPHPRFVGKTKMGPRGDSIVQADWQVGEVLRVLDELGLAKSTLVIFTSDNGPVVNDGYKDDSVVKLGDHKPAGPLKGGKYTIDEGGTRVPFIVRWPEKIAAAATSEAMISQVDFARTFAKLAGREIAADVFPDSQEMTAALTGDANGRGFIVQHSGKTQLAIRVGDWKYVESGPKSGAALYNLATDLGETTNLAEMHPGKVKELSEKLGAIRGGTQADGF